MVTCTRRIQFCAGHRLVGHEGKCKHLHGHNYVALLTARGDGLDPIGRVIDFGVLKERMGGWVESHWDHGFILNSEDPLVALWTRDDACAAHKFFLLDANPTAENLASYLLLVVGPYVLGDTGIKLIEVELWETENCYATAVL